MSAAPRERLLLPILIPVTALAVIGFVLFVFSRILLDVSHTAATVVALLVAAAIMAIAGYVSTREHSRAPRSGRWPARCSASAC